MKRLWVPVVWLLFVGLVGWFHYTPVIGWWILGTALAVFLLILDRLLYVWWLKPFEQLSIQIQYWFRRHDFLAVIRLLWERGHEQSKLVLTSMGFALLWPLLMLYVFTSTGSVTAMGIVMGLGFHMTLSLIKGMRNISAMRYWFCWQIKRPFSESELRIISLVFICLFGLLTAALLAT